MLSTVVGGGVQGGSSITQQYVKNVLRAEVRGAAGQDQGRRRAAYADLRRRLHGCIPDRKLKEMKYAIGLEKKYSKDDDPRGYLNIAGFGGHVYGIEAAAQYYFGTHAPRR